VGLAVGFAVIAGEQVVGVVQYVNCATTGDILNAHDPMTVSKAIMYSGRVNSLFIFEAEI
jgi:hypothetical protein